MADNPELEALRNMIVEAHAIVSTSQLAEGRSARATEILAVAIALADDLLKKPPAAVIGKLGGAKTAERGSEYFKKIAGMRKTKAGGRPNKDSH
jgi:hypothetical protein